MGYCADDHRHRLTGHDLFHDGRHPGRCVDGRDPGYCAYWRRAGLSFGPAVFAAGRTGTDVRNRCGRSKVQPREFRFQLYRIDILGHTDLWLLYQPSEFRYRSELCSTIPDSQIKQGCGVFHLVWIAYVPSRVVAVFPYRHGTVCILPGIPRQVAGGIALPGYGRMVVSFLQRSWTSAWCTRDGERGDLCGRDDHGV